MIRRLVVALWRACMLIFLQSNCPRTSVKEILPTQTWPNLHNHIFFFPGDKVYNLKWEFLSLKIFTGSGYYVFLLLLLLADPCNIILDYLEDS